VKILKYIIVTGCFALLLPNNAFSQIISTSTPTLSIDSIGLQGNFDLYFYNSQNSVNVFSFKAGSAIQYLTSNKKHRLLSLNGISQMIMKSDESTSKDDRGVQHFRYNYIVSDKIEIEGFTQAQFNEPLKLGFRGLIGTGVRYVWHKNEDQFVYYGIGGMYNYEKQLSSPIEWHEYRINTYIAINRRFNEKIVASLNFYYQPKITNSHDFRVSSTSTFELYATKHLGFKIGLNLQHDSTPIEDPEIHKFTYTLVSGLTYRF